MPDNEEEARVKQQAAQTEKSGDLGNGGREKKEKTESRAEAGKKEKTELEVFQAGLEKETQKIQDAIDKVQIFLHKLAIPLSQAAPNLEGEQAVRLKTQYEAALKQAGDMVAMAKRFKPELQTRLARLQSLEMKTAQEVNSFPALVEEAAGLVASLREYSVKIPQLAEQAQKIYGAYELGRVKEQGYESREDLMAACWEKNHQVGSLRREWFGAGKWVNREKIAGLEAEREQLQEIGELYYQRISVEGQHELSPNDVENMANTFIDKAVQKCMRRYDQLLEETPDTAEASQEATLSDTEMESLNDQYIQTIVLPRLEEEKQSYRSLIDNGYRDYRQHLASLEDPENIAKFLALVKKSYGMAPGGSFSDAEKEAERQSFLTEVHSLPQGFSSLESACMNLQSEPTNKQFRQIMEFAALHQNWEKRQIIGQNYETVLESLKQLSAQDLKDSGIYLGDITYTVERKLRDLQEDAGTAKLKQFLLDYDARRLGVFKKNQQVAERLGEERIQAADRFIGQQIKNHIIKMDSHTDSCVNLGYKLFDYKEAEYAPLAILNAYREPGYSGERPFLSVHTGSSDETILYKYIASLDRTEMQKLKALNIPGCSELVELILANPTDFSKPGLHNHETGDFKDNPAYHQIQQQLIKMSVHFFKNGDHKMDFYLADLLDYVEGDLGEGYGLMLDILTSKADARTKDAVLQCAITRIRGKDEKAALVLLGAYNQLSGDVKKIIGEKAGELIWGMARREGEVAPQVLEGLSQVTGKTAGEVNQLIDFLREQYKVSYFSENVTPENISNYFEIATKPELCGFIRELRPYGYAFKIEHLPYLPEIMGNKDRLFAEIEDIKKYKPDFKYDLAYDFEYDSGKNGSKQVFFSDPYEIFAEHQGPQRILEILRSFADQKESSATGEALVPRNFSDAILKRLRRNDSVSSGKSLAERKFFTEEEGAIFQQVLMDLIKTDDSPVPDKGEKTATWEYFFPSNGRYSLPLALIARAPHRYHDFVQAINSPEEILFKALTEKGVLENYARGVYSNLEKHGNLAEGVAMEILRQRRGKTVDGIQPEIPKEIRDIFVKNLQGVIEQLNSIKDDSESKSFKEFILANLERFTVIPPEKRVAYIEIFKKIDNSPSQEIQRIKDPLMKQILETEDPVAVYDQIESIFIKNNLPTIGKVYKIFQVLYPPQGLAERLKAASSPTLLKAGNRRRYFLIYKDLLKVHIDSGNRSLRDYAQVLQQAENILQAVEAKGFENLSEEERGRLDIFCKKLDTLQTSSQLGLSTLAVDLVPDENLKARYGHARESLGMEPGQSFNDRIAAMYLKPVGVASIGELLERMHQKKISAHERGLEIAGMAVQGSLKLEEGDLLKGINDKYVSNILQNGSVAVEFLGSASGSDSTPFDTDVSRVSAEDASKGFNNAYENSLAKSYGKLLFALKNRGQFELTTPETPKLDSEKTELFQTLGDRHFGIRTGFATTEIDFMIANPELIGNRRDLEKIFYEIAQNGFYTPVVDIKGGLVFTPEMYTEYRRIFNGLERFDGGAFEFTETRPGNPYYQAVEQMRVEIRNNAAQTAEHSVTISGLVKNVLGEIGVVLKDEYDSSILGAELVDTGSTGRGTNLPGDFDFDFSLKLDTADFPKALNIVKIIRQRMKIASEDSHAEENGYYQFRAKGVTEIDGHVLDAPIDIDIGFAKKSDLSVYGSQDAVKEKLANIKEINGNDAYEQAIANILVAKKVLKAGKAYKKLEDGGFGGIGTENWILANGANFAQALETFKTASREEGQMLPIEEFKKRYKIFDAGVNIKYLGHDNYAEILKPGGYAALAELAGNYLSNPV